ncbi:MAG: GNAT family N-acetyltransferase [Alkalibacterium sp.]|nr:GNAT family N-acetyltransferase [Alkalibacterium sp.]
MIRDARKEDAEDIVDLFKVILTDMELPIMTEVSWDRLKPALIDAVKGDNYRQNYKNAIVKVIDGEIAGFCFGYKGGSETEYESLKTVIDAHGLPAFETYSENETVEGEWYLDSIVTKAEYRGKGVGKELMAAAYARAKAMGIPVVGLNVDHGNPRARELYEAQGFEKTKEIMIADHAYDHMQKHV